MISVIQSKEYIHQPIVEECSECDRKILDEEGQTVCRAYLIPKQKWRFGKCPLATHISTIIGEDADKKRVGQQKQKKKKKKHG